MTTTSNLLADTTTILAVEDSDADFEAMARAFTRAGLLNTIIRCENGREAINLLRHPHMAVDEEGLSIPCLILLDLNMPGIDGREVLRFVKADPHLRAIPVVVLTTSDDERDIEDCYALGANSYIVKPVDFPGFIKAVQSLRQYWFEIVILPRPDSYIPDTTADKPQENHDSGTQTTTLKKSA